MQNQQDQTNQDNRQRWQHIVADFISSGLRQSEYCKRHDLKPEQLSYYYLTWRRKNLSQETLSFIPVKIDHKDAPEGKFVLTTINGSRLDIPADFSQSALEKLLLSLRRAVC